MADITVDAITMDDITVDDITVDDITVDDIIRMYLNIALFQYIRICMSTALKLGTLLPPNAVV